MNDNFFNRRLPFRNLLAHKISDKIVSTKRSSKVPWSLHWISECHWKQRCQLPTIGVFPCPHGMFWLGWHSNQKRGHVDKFLTTFSQIVYAASGNSIICIPDLFCIGNWFEIIIIYQSDRGKCKHRHSEWVTPWVVPSIDERIVLSIKSCVSHMYVLTRIVAKGEYRACSAAWRWGYWKCLRHLPAVHLQYFHLERSPSVHALVFHILPLDQHKAGGEGSCDLLDVWFADR